MNRTLKFVLAGLLTISLALVATSVWAETTKNGSLGPRVDQETQRCSQRRTINMRDAAFTLLTQTPGCDFSVYRNRNSKLYSIGLPAGLVFRSDAFIVKTKLNNAAPIQVQVCFAYSPQDARKNSSIYLQTAGGWVSLGGVVTTDTPKRICITTTVVNSTFALIGNR